MNDAGRRPGRGLIRTVLEACLAALLLMVFVIGFVAISGDSMEPTLHDGERALVPRFETWLRRLNVGEYRRGEIVFFPSPDQSPGAVCPLLCTHLIKRIVGVGGDTVEIRNGRLLLNGQPISEPYLGEGWRGSFAMDQVFVPEGHVFVLGDNRLPYGSYDSRAFGPVPVARIEGRAAWVVWPLLRRDESGGWRLNLRRLTDGGVARPLEPGGQPRPGAPSGHGGSRHSEPTPAQRG